MVNVHGNTPLDENAHGNSSLDEAPIDEAPTKRSSAVESGSISAADRAHELLVRGSKKGPSRGMTLSQWQASIHHLHLADANLSGDLDLLRWAPSLQVLYVYQNHLTSLRGLGGTKRLTHVYANNNQLTELGFEAGDALEQLHLNGNRIATLSGLQGACSLALLDLGGQRLDGAGKSEDASVQVCVRIERESLWGMAPSLRNLNLSGCALEDEGLAQLVVLQQLQSLDLSTNLLDSTNVLSQLLFRLPRLGSLQVGGNPFLTARPKWREALIITGESLKSINSKPVAVHERTFLVRLAAKRSGLLKQTARKACDGPSNSAGTQRPASVNAMQGPDAVVGDFPPVQLTGGRPLPGRTGPHRWQNGVQQ